MMKKTNKTMMVVGAVAASAALVPMAMAKDAPPAKAKVNDKAKADNRPERLKRGEYLVTIGGCNDCHTPLKMGENGAEFDMTRMLSGHPEQLKMPPSPKLPAGPWGVVSSLTNTAHSGPWGTSFTANLTPDKETGTGAWTEEQFMATIRTGRHHGRGRPILPPMPWFNYAKMTDDDLKSVYAYLQSIPAIKNRVPQPLPPEAPGPSTAAK